MVFILDLPESHCALYSISMYYSIYSIMAVQDIESTMAIVEQLIQICICS